MASTLIYGCLAIQLAVAILLLPLRPLLPVLSSEKHLSMSFSPNHLTKIQVVYVIAFLLIKPLLRYVHLVPRLQAASGNDQSKMGAHSEYHLPDLHLSMPLKLGETDFVNYDIAVRAADKSESGSRHLFLASVTTPLMLLMLAQRACPILPLGGVNVRNRFEYLKPDLCTKFSPESSYHAEARLLPHARRVKRGLEVDIVVEVLCELQGFSQPITIFRQTVTILQFMKTVAGSYHEPAPFSVPSTTSPNGHPPTEAATLYIETDAPFYWARVCKDYNPIHVSRLGAKAFGFPGKLAHGNLVVARAIYQLAGQEGQIQQLFADNQPWWLEVEFKRPVVVPKSLQVWTSAMDSQSKSTNFQLNWDAKTFITGAAGWL